METSRDDFVIAIRSAFLKKGTQQRFSLISLIFFSLTFLILSSLNYKVIDYLKIGINEIVYRSSYIVSKPENIIKEAYISTQQHFSLYKENEKNKSELEIIRTESISNQIIELENIRLKQMIDDYFISDNEIFAKVLIDKKSPFLRSIIINKGSKNDIEMGMAVLDDIYFIGKVIEVNYTTSRVLLVSDINSKIPVSLEPKNIQAIMSGNGDRNGIIEYFNENDLDNKNDDWIVYTSGMSGLQKSGIPIGTIDKKENFYNKQIIVNFYRNLSQAKYVKVISFKKENLASEAEIKKKVENVGLKILQNSSNEKINILEKQKIISNEIKKELKNENNLLNIELSKLKNETQKIKKENEAIKNELNNIDITQDELKFLRLNLLYADKCKKNIINIFKKDKTYKVGTLKYRQCIMRMDNN